MQKLLKVLLGHNRVLGFYREGKNEPREIEDDREVVGILRNIRGQKQGEHGVLVYMPQEEYEIRLKQDEEGEYDLK